MKLVIYIAVFCFSFASAVAQQFEESKDYYGAFQSSLDENKEEVSSLLIYNKKLQKEVTLIPIAQASVVSNIKIETLDNPGLAGVSQVLKVTITYEDYCTFNASSYVLETQNGGYITLPMLTNEDCGDLHSTLAYVFPSQAFGKTNEIIKAQVVYVQNNPAAIEQVDNFIWKDDNYGTAATLYDNF